MNNSKVLYIVLGVLAVLALWVWTGYNGLVSSKAAVEGSWAQVETQYQRRIDLVPNLVSTVKGAANFEQETFTAITEARSQWQGAGSRDEKINAASGFDSALSRLLVTVEAYPQLQATQAFRDLMTQLEGTENRISTARRDFNTAVQTYNVRVARFPSNLLAGMFGFESEKMFSADEGADKAPAVNF
ncbi:MAG: LemA family protein [Candidatus Peribacteraceae bacterium]|nr:LemA family protein [Candidatus Peribacteraceae bacterium]